MDERHEELASLNALGMLENDEKRALDGATARDKDLRALSSELEDTVAELGLLVTPVEPPADMKRRIRAKLRSTGAKGMSVSRGFVVGSIGWALAAAFAVASVWLWQQRSALTDQLTAASRAIAPMTPAVDDGKARTLEEELKKLRNDYEVKKSALSSEIVALNQRESDAKTRIAQLTAEVSELKEQNANSKVQIATLQSKVWEYRRSEMVVVWDEIRGQGVVLLDNMPRVESGKDYQLWVVDPKKPDPISAGVVTVDKDGAVQTQFKPVEPVSGEAKFAISVEKKGGVEKNEGPIVLVGP